MNELIFSFGTDIRSASAPLESLSIEQLYNKILTPDDALKNQTNRLRTIKSIDKKRYSELKRNLPFVVCAHFKPAFRRTENFCNTDSFIVDIDHIAEKGYNINTLRQQIQADQRVMLCYISPSGDGLKLFFRLSKPCHDHGIYSLFYKNFVQRFASDNNLSQVVDTVTCDVCRACFICYDENAYLNPLAECVVMENYVDTANTFLMEEQLRIEKEQQKREKEIKKQAEPPRPHDPESDDIQRIKEILKLNTSKHPQKEKAPAYVPEILEEIIPNLTIHANNLGVEITEVININYGKKIRFKLGLHIGELNIFYGKRGFSVVQSPKSGTTPDFNQMCADIVKDFFLQNGIAL